MQSQLIRNVARVLIPLGFGISCSEPPTAGIRAFGTDPSRAVSDPPPPPADGTEIIWDGSGCLSATTCPNEEGPYYQAVALNAHFFKAPGAAVAFVTFSSDAPFVEISPNARVRDNGFGIEGTGRITSVAFLDPPPFPFPFPIATPIIVDLSTAAGSLRPVSGPRSFSFTAQGINAMTGAPLNRTVLFWYTY